MTWRGILVVVALAGCGDGAHGPISLNSDQGAIEIGENVALSGTAPGIDSVELQTDPYPFGRFDHKDTVAPDAEGRFEFAVAPDRNTRYRVVDREGGAEPSPAVRIFVRPKFDMSPRRLGPHRAEVSVRAQVPSNAELSHAGVYVYLGREGRPLTRVARLRLRQRGSYAIAKGSVRFRVERFRRRDRLFLCTTEPLAEGMADDLFGAGCGEKTISP